MIASIIVSGLLSRKSIMQTRESIEDNHKTQSAYISLQLLDKILEDKFKEINNKILDNKITKSDITELEIYLNHFEDMC